MMSWVRPVVLVLVVAVAGCAAPLQSSGSGAAPVDAVSTVDVTGTGQVSADADLAVVFVSVTARADTAAAVRSTVASDTDRMRSALRNNGLPDDAVTTVAFRVSPRYNTSGRQQDIIGYEGVHTVRIDVAPARAGRTIDLAVENGADEVAGVQFTLRDETRSALRQQAMTRAVGAARADADTVAAAANLSITGVRHVSTSGGFSPSFETRVDAADGAGTTLDPGPVTVATSVHITYTVEPA
jgi:uncharacterized protein YggE